jgi:hypothetical protein
MADDRNSRDKQADDAERRQQERELAEELERTGEPEPAPDAERLVDIEKELNSLEYPSTGAEIVEALGDRVVDSSSETYEVQDVVPDTDEEVFGSPSTVLKQVQRPKVAEAMKRIVETNARVSGEGLGDSQRKAYEKTLRRLRDISPKDDDEGVEFIADWIVEKLESEKKLPGSRVVRKEAAKFCRKSGYTVRNDDWLGV